ncbi:hypothetical protein [Saccharicrinis fermentans]|uniref:SpoIIAA-like protein n=1 Tax=Saccharicrinis fermentans DSM 9555 = JCM 21142 TaxID=869213 RepID=W7YFW7_9BACT|nr:hypothetical protein [Saccharicrinis fermentans]GAF01489.1 hypothetical protein JCM21142_97 [Saccharicrinis fermentans DSM 9555 = JCM 21142]
MSFSVKHTCLENDSILIRSFSGSVVMQDVIDAWKSDIKNGIVHSGLKGIVTDFTHCKNNATIDELQKIVEFYKDNITVFEHIKLAVVLDAPNVIVLLLFEETHADMHHKAFSTFNAALAWVKK